MADAEDDDERAAAAQRIAVAEAMIQASAS